MHTTAIIAFETDTIVGLARMVKAADCKSAFYRFESGTPLQTLGNHNVARWDLSIMDRISGYELEDMGSIPVGPAKRTEIHIPSVA